MPQKKTRVKICGITNWVDARRAMALGADALGFNFVKRSPRYIDPRAARKITQRLSRRVIIVGVFVNEPLDTLAKIAVAVGVQMIQLHGEESPAYVRRVAKRWPVIKAFRVGSRFRLSALRPYQEYVTAFLLDGKVAGLHGGTGEQFDWDVVRHARKFGTIFLAGGLRPENVREAILVVRPDFVDVASGVESRPGKKHAAKLRKFFREVKTANQEKRSKR